MSMTVGSGSRQKAEINMAPMIDVLLVLIIIFMVITPLAPRGLDAAIPQQASDVRPPALSRDLVITVAKGEQIEINQQVVESGKLGDRLAEIYRLGASRHVFVRADRELEYQAVVRVIDLARGAGWDRVGLMTR